MQKNKERNLLIQFFAVVIYSLLPKLSFENINIVGGHNVSFANKINLLFILLLFWICYFKKLNRFLTFFIISLYVVYFVSLLFLR